MGDNNGSNGETAARSLNGNGLPVGLFQCCPDFTNPAGVLHVGLITREIEGAKDNIVAKVCSVDAAYRCLYRAGLEETPIADEILAALSELGFPQGVTKEDLENELEYALRVYQYDGLPEEVADTLELLRRLGFQLPKRGIMVVEIVSTIDSELEE